MSKINPQIVLGLANTYAQYFAADFSKDVMKHLSASYPIGTEQLNTYVEQSLETLSTETPLTIGNNGTIGRFLFECAEYALESHADEPDSRQVWDQVSNLPSIHHDEIRSMVFTSAGMYQTLIDKTLVDVIAKDSLSTSQAISQAAQSRSTMTETGGDVSAFSWGLLNDGLWLNSALVKGYEMASVFRPGDKVSPQYATTAFAFARQKTMFPPVEGDINTLYGEIDILVSQMDSKEAEVLFEAFPQTELSRILFVSGVLFDHAERWERGSSKAGQLIPSVDALSSAARALMALRNTARLMEDQSIISDVTKARLDTTYDVVTLMLVGYEALRETKFSDSLILGISSDHDDPKVSVVTNGDLLNTYRMSGGDEGDLVKFGLYLDPRKGMDMSTAGYSMEYILARRESVIPEVMAQESERLEKLRNNDAAFIQKESIRIVNDVVSSYAEARQIDIIPKEITQSINGLARKITNSDVELKLDEEIGTILVNTINDPYLTHMAKTFYGNLNSDDPSVRNHAQALTVASSALHDVVQYITDKDINM